MALLDRLSGKEEPKLPVHQFQAALRLWQLGEVTRSQVISEFDVTAGEESDLDFLKSKSQAATDKSQFGNIIDAMLMLAEGENFGLDDEATFVAMVNGISV